MGEKIRKAAAKKRRTDPIEVICPKCQHTEIVYLSDEEMPRCPECRKEMVFKEVLKEGKSY